MPAVNLSPIFNGWQAFTAGGLPLSNGLLWTYQSGTSTPQATYTTSAGNVANTNPIQLGPDGRPPQEIWLVQGQAYRFTLLDALSNPVGGPYDNIVNDGGQIRVDLADAANLAHGAGMVGFGAAQAYAVGTEGRALKDRSISVTDSPYLAVGDGVVDDTAAFTSAAAVFPYVYLPAGKTFKVTAGLNYWQFWGPGAVFEDGQQWAPNPFPQNAAATKVYRPRTFGNYEDAVCLSVTANSTSAQTRANTQIQGTTTQNTAQNNAYDHVSGNFQINSFEPDAASAATTYTATTLTDVNVGTFNATAGRIKPGMFVKTKHATPYGGRVRSVAGNVITVDGWWLQGTGVAGTPANGTGALINPNDKLWGLLIGMFVSGNAGNNQAQKGAGIELDISCDPTTSGQNVWGFDTVTTGGKPEMHYQSRGSSIYGFYRPTGADYAYVSQTNGIAFEARDSTSYDFQSVVATVRKWSVGGGGGWVVQDFRKIRAVSGNTTLAADDYTILVTAGVTITLPAASGNSGRCIALKMLSAGATIATGGGNIVPPGSAAGAATWAPANGAQATLQSDGSAWYAIHG